MRGRLSFSSLWTSLCTTVGQDTAAYICVRLAVMPYIAGMTVLPSVYANYTLLEDLPSLTNSSFLNRERNKC